MTTNNTSLLLDECWSLSLIASKRGDIYVDIRWENT